MPRDAKNMQHRQRIFNKMQFCGKFPSHGQNKPAQTPENVKTEKKLKTPTKTAHAFWTPCCECTVYAIRWEKISGQKGSNCPFLSNPSKIHTNM